MKVLIVDDEQLARSRLQRMLQNEGMNDLLQAKNGSEAIELIKIHHPWLVFLDIEMPGIKGVDVAQQIKTLSPESEIIFCTAYSDFAIEAFDLSAVDYLLKPVSQNRLKEALAKTKLAHKQKNIRFKKGNDLISIPVSESYCFVSEEKYIYMHSSYGVDIIDESLNHLEEKYKNNLIRIHRNTLVNKNEICGIHREGTKTFVLLTSTNYQPLISRRNITAVKQILE